jgi:sulfide:quinone oxidoreductase
VSGATTFRDQRDVRRMSVLLGELASGAVRRVGFALPVGSAWPLPLYELALRTAHHARRSSPEPAYTLVSAESTPLEMFGPAASRAVGGLLAEAGVRFAGAAAATEVRRDGRLMLADGDSLEADRVVAMPQLRGRRLAGLPATRLGFVPVDAGGRVQGLDGVYAAGDVTSFPIKQGGLATQQADLVAQTIAADLGAPVRAVRPALVLQARLLGGAGTMSLRAELDWNGRPTTSALGLSGDDVAAARKVTGRYLQPYLEALTPVTGHPGIPASSLRVTGTSGWNSPDVQSKTTG